MKRVRVAPTPVGVMEREEGGGEVGVRVPSRDRVYKSRNWDKIAPRAKKADASASSSSFCLFEFEEEEDEEEEKEKIQYKTARIEFIPWT